MLRDEQATNARNNYRLNDRVPQRERVVSKMPKSCSAFSQVVIRCCCCDVFMTKLGSRLANNRLRQASIKHECGTVDCCRIVKRRWRWKLVGFLFPRVYVSANDALALACQAAGELSRPSQHEERWLGKPLSQYLKHWSFKVFLRIAKSAICIRLTSR